MTASLRALVVIPSRLAATRLPNKPLADILGQPMIVHVWRRAMEADLGPVIVACGDKPIADAIEKAGGQAILTDPAHPSGSDRVWEAVQKADPKGEFPAVVNLQGDLPTIEKSVVQACLEPLREARVDIATLGTLIKRAEERDDPNVVKAVAAIPDGARIGRALYFSRATVPTGPGPLYHHIGIYAYRREALRRFVAAPLGILEKREKLEQLRALEMGMRIDLALVDTVPLGVDTPADLDRAREMLALPANPEP